MKLFGLLLLASISAGHVYAQDVYDPATKQLSIPSVKVGKRIYTNVVITVGDILSVGEFYEVDAEAFSLNEAYKNSVAASAIRRFSISGNLFGSGVSGNGTETVGRLSATSFLGSPAFSKTANVTMTLYSDGEEVPLSFSVTSYLDGQNRLLGMTSPEEMEVVEKYFGLPEQALPNDTGILYESTVYQGSTAVSPIGKVRATYSTTYESANSLILQVILTRTDNLGKIESTTSSISRVGRDKTVSPISGTATSADGTFTISY